MTVKNSVSYCLRSKNSNICFQLKSNLQKGLLMYPCDKEPQKEHFFSSIQEIEELFSRADFSVIGFLPSELEIHKVERTVSKVGSLIKMLDFKEVNFGLRSVYALDFSDCLRYQNTEFFKQPLDFFDSAFQERIKSNLLLKKTNLQSKAIDCFENKKFSYLLFNLEIEPYKKTVMQYFDKELYLARISCFSTHSRLVYKCVELPADFKLKNSPQVYTHVYICAQGEVNLKEIS